MIDLPSATAYSPPVIIEPADRRGGASPAPRLRQVTSTPWIGEDTFGWSDLNRASVICLEIEARLRSLRIEAYSEGINLNEGSISDFRAFQLEHSPRKRPAIFFTSVGNIRAVWKKGPEQLSLQFFGKREVQFVIFSARRGSASLNRLAGNVTVDSVISLARVSAVDHVLSA